MSGYEKITSVDLQVWLTKESLVTTLAKFREWHSAGRLADYLPDFKEERWRALEQAYTKRESSTLEHLRDQINCDFIIGDARNLDIPSGAFHFICSNNTFEHIPAFILKDILKEFDRLLKPDGVMSHFVDLSDHFAHFDRSINIYNFLRYSEKQWARIDNSIQPQNRLRWPAYRAMYEKLGIAIIEESTRPGDLKALAKVPVSEELAHYSKEELAISHGYLVTSN